MMSLDQNIKLRPYIRGFIIASGGQAKVPASYVPLECDDLHIYVDRATLIQQAEDEHHSVFVFGVVVDTVDARTSPSSIVRDLLVALKQGRDRLFMRLREIGGRHAILFKDESGYFLLNDAGGVRSVFYHIQGKDFVVASHAKLVADQFKTTISSFSNGIQSLGEGYRARNWPGRTSKYEGVYQLTPNTYISLPSGDISRFYPFEPLPERDPQQAAQLIKNYLLNSISGLALHYCERQPRSLLLLLSSGIDSRLVLSTVRAETGLVEALTYKLSERHEADIHVAHDLAKIADIRHHVFTDRNASDDQVSAWATTNGASLYVSSKAVVNDCYRRFSDFKYSLRGNLGEISRGVFQGRTAYVNDPARFMARVWFRGSEKHSHVLDCFKDYADAVQIDKAPWPLRILYYWEHKHSTWHAATANELDLAFDTFNVLNSRNIIEAMCGVSEAAQANDAVHCELIRMLWPELMEIPVNPEKYPLST